jgi:3-oxoacyl-[acyl-carrier protein] reductase
MFTDLKDKAVIITGGGTGIGGAASQAFAGEGARVLAHYWGGGPEVAALEKRGIATIRLDLTAAGAPQALIDEGMRRFGRLDVIVNNAGSLVERRPLAGLDDELIDRIFELNCRQLVHCCRLAADIMVGQKSGSIINVTSIAARNGASPGGSVYAGAKGFVSAFSKSLARELVGEGIRVNCVSPGTIHTAFHERFSDEAKREAARRTIPMGRLGLAEDCAGTFLYLASDRASGYVTGQVIEVNGGQLMA